MRLCPGVLLFCLLLAAPAPPARAEGKVDFHLRFVRGDVHAVRMKLDQTIEETLDGKRQQTRQTIVLGCTFTVAAVDPQGTATIGMKYDSASLHARTATGPVDYDSAGAPGEMPPMASGLAAMVGRGYSLTLTRDGTILKITGLPELLDAVLARLNLPEGPARAAAEKVLRKQLDENTLKGNLRTLFLPFPDHPVSEGDNWTRSTQIDLGFPVTTDSTYTLAGRSDGTATISVAGAVATVPQATLEMGQTKMSYEFSGRQSGSIQAAEATGWVQQASLTQQLSGTVTLRAPNQEARTIPVTIRSTFTVEPK